MSSTYSQNLRLELIGPGEQSGVWDTTTNTNLGTLLEQAITGVQTVTMVDADKTLSALNGSTDEARNVVLVMTSIGDLLATRNVIIPAVKKLYIVRNATTGGQSIVVKTSGGTGVTVPNGMTVPIYCDGINTYQQTTYLNTPTLNTPTLTGTPTAPTAPVETNTTQVATTAFVTRAVSNAFPSGTRLMFAQAAAPTGWTQVVDDSANNRMLRVVNTAGAGVGGSHSPILNNVVPSHTHNFTSGGQSNDHTHSGNTGTESAGHTHTFGAQTGGQSANHSHGYYRVYENSGQRFTDHSGQDTNEGWVWENTGGASNDHSHYVSGTTSNISANHYHGFSTGGVSANHTHSGTTDNGSSQTNWTPRYIDMILCSKN